MKRLVVFCDGTWNRMSAHHPTNVVIGAQSLLPRGTDGAEQITFYDEGVGTTAPVFGWIERQLAGAFGLGLIDKIASAYRFLIFNYEPGDEIFIFGFSRGAYTARSLAGLIRKCGVVPRANARRIEEIFRFYKEAESHPDSDKARQFRAEHCPAIILKEEDRDWRMAQGLSPEAAAALTPLTIRYLGVWDTVGALGVPAHIPFLGKLTQNKYQFHDTDLSSAVIAARHAVAVDENRKSFAPALWSNLEKLETRSGETGRYLQHWFAGDHGSVGGGGDIVGLSHLALLWVLEGAMREGLAFDEATLSGLAQDTDAMAPLSNQSKAPGLMSRIYFRGPRQGVEREDDLAEPVKARLAYEGKGEGFSPYRPETLRKFWPETGKSL